MSIFSIVIPVYNEEAVLHEAYRRLTNVMKSYEYELIFINDGSFDNTYEILKTLYENDEHVVLINFSRNFGHQAAITAGMDYARGDAIVIIDADMQDPPEVIETMITKWKDESFDVVYGKRIKRNGESLFKKLTAKIYYRLLNKLIDIDLPNDTGDFRLIDRKVCEAMKKLSERNRYVRGLVSWVGFRQIAVEYVRDERYAGKTKYPLRKMIRFALDGIFSFSYRPLRLATYFGSCISIISFIYLIVVLIQKMFTDTTIHGWTSTIAITLFFQGIILIILGLIGEYIGRIYDEIKNRPIYIVSDVLNR